MARCDFCGRSFARNEHLIRHQRIHTGERPFHCPHCKAGFQRPDVLAKHVQNIHTQTQSGEESHPRGSNQGTKRTKDRERSRLACDQCRKRKLKCDNVRPCESCRSKHLDCTVSSSSRPPGRPRNFVTACPIDQPITVSLDASYDDESIYSMPAPPAIEPWTPTSILPPILEKPHSLAHDEGQIDKPTSRNNNSCNAYFDATGLSINGVEDWMTSEPPQVPSVQAPFDVDAMQLPQMCDTMDLLNDLVPPADFGNWLDDLNEFSVVDEVWPQHSVAFDSNFDPSMDNAVDIMKSQLQRRSRASSPSQEAQQWSWYSMLPQLSVYDEETIDILLNVAKRHLSTTFAVFSDFKAEQDTRIELCLAMAAVGGLYCTVPGSTKIAKMLFNDSRRLMLEDNLRDATPSFSDSMSFAKTFVLLELYGLCSGDKRAYEFMEVFHGSKLHAMNSCMNAMPIDASASQRHHVRLVAEAMHVLDSYRVILLQRPPSFEGHLSPARSDQTTCNFEHLPTGGIISTAALSNLADPCIADMDHLATIIHYSWMVSPRDTDDLSLSSLWKPEFVEIALDRWIQAKSAEMDIGTPHQVTQMLLYHLTQVTLHTNMGALQRLAQTVPQNASSTQAGEDQDRTSQPWSTSRHSKVSTWHARVILRIAEGGLAPRRRRTSLDANRPQFVEPPHLPLCIYFATLVVWLVKVREGEDHDCSADALIESGSRLLLKLKVPVAKLLGTALCELLAADGS